MNDLFMNQNEPAKEAGQYSQIPEKFKDPNSGELNVEALLTSYLTLEKKFSEKSNAAPGSYEDYSIDCEHGLFSVDADINKRLYDKGFSQEQAQEVYDLAAERMIPLIMDVAAEFQAERELDRLVDHFGGQEKWQEISRQLLNYGQQNLPPEVLKGMASSYEGVMALYAMMKGEKTETPSPRTEIKASVSENELYSMMRSPKYWKEKDPGVIAKVTEGFQRLYTGK